MRQSTFTCIAECNQNVLYPIYEDRAVCSRISDTLGYDINKIIDKSFGKITTIYTLGKYPFESITFIGLGKSDDITTRKMRKAFEDIAKKNEDAKVFVGQNAVTDSIDVHKVAEIFAESYLIGAYKEQVIGQEAKMVPDMEVLVPGADIKDDIEIGKIYAEGINQARRLADTPSNMMTPVHLAEEAKEIARKYRMECEIIDKAVLEEMGAGGILAVNQGSHVPACMICLKYHGGEGPYKAVVGKGLTFDSGGYNIKDDSLGMKYDMCGGADVLGIMQILAAAKAKVNVYGIVPATENLVSGEGYKPQDVVKTLSGKTVEIKNTDAEGRMILCDGLTYAQRLGATHVIDLATLTGACIKALGFVYTGVFANDDEFYQTFETAMSESDEKGWRLPLDEEFFEQLKSNSADFANSGRPGEGGASVAAGFLNQFIEDGVKWIHLDIAGTADNNGTAATGAMIRSVVNVLQK